MLLIECIFPEYFSDGGSFIFGGGEVDDPIKIQWAAKRLLSYLFSQPWIPIGLKGQNEDALANPIPTPSTVL